VKLPVIQDKDFIIYLEYHKDLFWLHTDVFKWSSEVKKNFLLKLDQLQQAMNTELFGLVDNDKLEKFGKAIGFEFYQTTLGFDNQEYKVFIRRNRWES
jgi:hypothetical protein